MLLESAISILILLFQNKNKLPAYHGRKKIVGRNSKQTE